MSKSRRYEASNKSGTVNVKILWNLLSELIFKKHLNEEWSSVNENTHNFKIEHITAFKHKYRMYIYNAV